MSSGTQGDDDPPSPRLAMEGMEGQHDIFFAAVQMTRMPMVVVDVRSDEQPIVFSNDAFAQLTGYNQDEITGHNCRFLQGADTDRDTVADIRRAIRERANYTGEVLNYRKDGSAFWNALFLSPVFNEQEELLYYFGSQLDVTRRREAEDGLRQAQKMEAVGQLTGGLAHDFNNLLTIVVGQIETAQKRTEDPRALLALNRALEATERGARLTQQLLAFARKQRLQGRTVSLNRLVSSLTDLLQRTLGAAVDIRTELADDLPLCRIDPVQAETALLNILINARDAMPAGGRVSITTARHQVEQGDAVGPLGDLQPGFYAAVSITDTGTGMPNGVLARATEPFFTTKEVGRGSGMGLAMVYGFARQSRGAMTIDSQPGHGTTVRLLFPAVDAAEPEGKPGRTDTAPVGGTETVLVVEDDTDILELARDMLQGLGYTMLTARSAADALQILHAPRTVDLLFTDVVLPGGMDGVRLAREARRLRPSLPVLLTSGFSDPAGAPEAGDFELIEKPYRHSVLAAKIRDVLRRRNIKT